MPNISSYTVETASVLQTHTHRHAHMILPVQGFFFIRFRGAEYQLLPGQICFCPPETEHDYRCQGETLVLNIPKEMVKPTDVDFLSEKAVLEVDERLEPLVRLIKQEVEDPMSRSESVRYLFYYLYDKFVERRSFPALVKMKDNYADPSFSIAELAEMENYNNSYFTEWFKEKTGFTPSEYLHRIRMEKAQEILESTHYRILDVALQVGYTNASSFSRAFRNYAGMTPQQYRSKNQEEST